MKRFNLETLVDLIAIIFFMADNNYGKENNTEEPA